MTTTGVSVSVMAREQASFASGLCPAMQSLESVLAEIALTTIPVLLVGESGTGKAVYAHHLHKMSARSEDPLVTITCAAMNPALLSAELGISFNGTAPIAGSRNAGTIFFDEISELDSACQRNLLYALPDGATEMRRGALTGRVVSTTSRNLEEEMRAGRFRGELYYRINGVCLRLPPLRERKEDVPLLVEFFLTKYAAQFGRPRPTLSPRTLRTMIEHSWPGNIRELENVIKKIVALGDERLAVSELETPPEIEKVEEVARGGYSLKAAARAASREAERELILKALAHTRWNRKRAAQALQISYKSLLYKLKQIGVADSVGE